MDYRLEAIILPVSDVEASKAFYEQCGFVLDTNHRASDDFWVLQFTPPGSACSVMFGLGISTTEPGSVKGLHLAVRDIEAAHAELTGRGIKVGDIRHMGPQGWVPGVHPERADYSSFSELEDPDGNLWLLQEIGHGQGQA